MEQVTKKSPTAPAVTDDDVKADKSNPNYGELASIDGFWKSLKSNLAGRAARDEEMSSLKAINFAEPTEKPVVNI